MTDIIWYTCQEPGCGLRFKLSELTARCHEYPDGKYNHVEVQCASAFCRSSVMWFYEGMTRSLALSFWRTVPIVPDDVPDSVVREAHRSLRSLDNRDVILSPRDEAAMSTWRQTLKEMGDAQILVSLLAGCGPMPKAPPYPIPRPRLPKVLCQECRRSSWLVASRNLYLVSYGEGASCDGFGWTCCRCYRSNWEFVRATPWSYFPGLLHVLRDEYGASEHCEPVPDQAVCDLFTRRFKFAPPDIT